MQLSLCDVRIFLKIGQSDRVYVWSPFVCPVIAMASGMTENPMEEEVHPLA
jgi:hypothetical protein